MHKRLDQRGGLDPLLIPLLICLLLVFGLTGFGIWSYTQFTDQRDNVNAKINAAVKVATDSQRAELDKQFLEREKEPLKTYQGPRALGAVTIEYPKTWAAYVKEDPAGSPNIEGYFHPSYVRDTDSKTADALRVTLVSSSYSDEIQEYEGLVEEGKVKIKATKLAGITGIRIDGELEEGMQGSMVVVPLRDKTLRLWTESPEFRADFDNIILRRLKLTP